LSDQPLIARLWENTEPIPHCGCWIFIGPLRSSGHGRIWVDDAKCQVHRVAYEILKGPIPAGLELDHKCRVPSCWNPQHLEPVTHKENTLRGESPSAQNARKTHCSSGHPFIEENTRLRRADGARVCRVCDRERQAQERDILAAIRRRLAAERTV
jgi:hypothetical protein